MAEKKRVKNRNNVSLKALMDTGSNKVIFVESNSDFIDVLFSFLTMPMGRIVRLACKSSVPVKIGCMRNLYQSIEKIDMHDFRSNACRDMLLLPCNAADCQCKNLKLNIDNGSPTRYFLCYDKCFLSYYGYIPCPSCTCPLTREIHLPVDNTQAGGVFVKGRSRLIITDDLQVISPVSAASICLFSKLGVTDSKTTEELTFNMGVPEVLNFLLHSFVSKTPLTDTLLKNKPIPNLGDVHSSQGTSIDSQMHGDTINEEEEEKNISLKIAVSKSKKIVCYAEAQEDFVNLLCSFLTLPLGFILKKMRNVSWKGCLDQLYKSVEDLDEQYLKSNYHRELLVNPKLAPGFRYENPLLGIEEASFYYVDKKLTTDKSCIPDNTSAESVNVLDPKSHEDRDKTAQGYLKGPATFTVTDNLVVRPLSLILEMSVLQELKVPFTDIEDHIVHMGKREALLLLVASFIGDSALTNTFIRELREPRQER